MRGEAVHSRYFPWGRAYSLLQQFQSFRSKAGKLQDNAGGDARVRVVPDQSVTTLDFITHLREQIMIPV